MASQAQKHHKLLDDVLSKQTLLDAVLAYELR